MASAQAMATPHNVALLTSKLHDADSDIRYMSLNDLSTIFQSQNSSFLVQDYNQCAKIVDGFLHTLNDPSGEVQNMAIKCLGPFVLKVNPDILCPMIHKIANLTTDNTIDNSISALAVRAIVVALPRPSPGAARTKPVLDAYSAISRVLIPRLVGYIVIPQTQDKNRPAPPKGLLQEDLEKGSDSNSMDVLIEVVRCFGPLLHKSEVQALQKISWQILESPRTGSVMKKKAITALSALSHHLSDSALSAFISSLIEKLTNPHLTPAQRKLYITVMGSLARAIPKQFGGNVRTLAPFVLSVLSARELDEEMEGMEEDGERDPQIDEVKEAALVTVDAFMINCQEEMERYKTETIESALLYLKYDPNVAQGEDDIVEDAVDDDDADDDFELDEDFEEEGGLDDEDDMSWKARRCAAKLVDTIIAIRGKELLDNGELYERIASSLVARFTEREETVRLEVFATLTNLIRRSGESDHVALEIGSSIELEQTISTGLQSRKRRRGASDASMLDVVKFRRITGSQSPEAEIPSREGAAATLAKLSPDLVRSALKLFDKGTTLATKQALVSLLKILVITRHGGLEQNLDALLGPLTESIKTSDSHHSYSSSSGQGGVTSSTLRIEALQLLAEVLKTHSSKVLQPYMAKIVEVVVEAMKARQPKVSCEASATAEQLAKALTPPRSASTSSQSQGQLTLLFEAAIALITAKDSDIEVRRSAIRNVGLLVGRCSPKAGGQQLMSAEQHSRALDVLWKSLKNETLRLASITAINTVASLNQDLSCFTSSWFQQVCIELGAQLRKSSRLLRGSSLAALDSLITESRSELLDENSTAQLSSLLQPLLTSNDLQLLVPTLNIYAVLAQRHGSTITNAAFNVQLCAMMTSSIATSALTELNLLVRAIAGRGAGQALMQLLLKDATNIGNPIIIGKVIGCLLVYGDHTVGVDVNDFLKELETTSEPQKKQLALSVLGEVGLRSGTASPLSPELFISYFNASSEMVQLAAASALGRAAAGPGNVQQYIPAILSRLQQNAGEQYIVLHSIKEILQDESISAHVIPYAGSLWDASVAASRTDETKTIGAECVANLVLMQPKKFLPALHALLSDQDSGVRGLGINALRDVFAGSDGSYDKDLRPIIIEALTTILRDSDLENRRSALNAFNAAARNKPSLVFPNIRQVLPLIMDLTHEDPSLIREESVGPFKHKIDDGLQVRKGAYETLYSLMEIAFQRIDVVQLYDRVVEGIGDDHDIRTLCNLMITKLLVLAPEETARRLDAIAERSRSVLSITLKDTAVKQEHEKTDESKRGVIKASIALNQAFGTDGSANGSGSSARVNRPNWTAYWDWMRKEHVVMWKEVEREAKERP